MMQTEFFRLEILTPVHIGTGDELDPMNYLMREEETGPTCHVVNTNAWAAEYPDPDELCSRFSGRNVSPMRNFLAESLNPEIYGVRRIAVTDSEIYREYLKKRDDQRTSNQLLLSPQMSSNGQSPIIPGSSLKGAIRTAVIDWLDREEHLGLKTSLPEYNKKLERALGPITDNAFKQLKVSDVEGWCDSTVLVEALEIRRKQDKSTTPKSKCEGLPSRVLGDGAAAILYGKLSLGTAGQKGEGLLVLPGGKSWSWIELCALTKAYLLPRLDVEIDRFYRQQHFAKALPVVQALRQELVDAADGQMYLRVGHYSQVEFVTVRDNQPQTKGKGGKQLPHGTTRTLANGLFPFGWVRMTPCSEDEYRQGVAEREEVNRRAVESRNIRRAEHYTVYQQKNAERIKQLAVEKAAREERERVKQEEAAKPWLAFVRQARQLTDWGALKQFIERPEIKDYQENADLSQAVRSAAMRVRDDKPDKWSEDRASQVNEWLSAAGCVLPEAAEQPDQPEPLPEDVQEVQALKDFSDYQQASIDLTALSPQALTALIQKMQQWECHKKKSKPNKREAYDQARRALAKLK